MKKDFYTVSKTAGGQSDPVIRQIALPGGGTAHILRREVYEHALRAAGKVLVQVMGETQEKMCGESGVLPPEVL